MHPNVRLAGLLAASLAFRLAVCVAPGFRADVDTFASWAQALATLGPQSIYGPGIVPAVDYPPGYLYALWAAGYAHALLGGGELGWRLVLKAPPIFADLACIALLHAIVRRRHSERAALLVAAIASFAPLLWLDSAYWGQVDAIPIAFGLAALYLAGEDRALASWVCLWLGALVKPQVVVIAPILAVLQLRAVRSAPLVVARDAGLAACAGALLAYASVLPFTPLRAPLDAYRFLAERYFTGLSKAPHATEGAFNLYAVAGPFFTSDATAFAGVPDRVWGLALVSVAVVVVTYAFARSLEANRSRTDDATFAAAALVALALFLFATRMHERYVLPAIVFALPLALDDLPTAAVVAWLTVTFAINCAFIIAGFYGGAHHPAGLLVARACAVGNVVSLGLLAERFRRRFAG